MSLSAVGNENPACGTPAQIKAGKKGYSRDEVDSRAKFGIADFPESVDRNGFHGSLHVAHSTGL